MIEITVNGETKQMAEPTALADALRSWGYACERIAVAINGEFVARDDYARRQLRPRDTLDVVAPVQGG